MGTKITDIVDVQITRESAKITRVGFGTGLIFGTFSNFAESYRTYTDIDGVAEDFLVTDEVYLAAAAYFSQELKPERVYVGKRAANVAQSEIVTVDTVENAVTYTVTINGTAFDFLSDADATEDEITAGLEAAINGGSEPVTATDNANGTMDLDADVLGEAFTVTVSDDGAGTDLSVANAVANVSVATELASFVQEQNDWYMLGLIRTATEAGQLLDIEQAAGFIEPRLKMFIAASDQASLLTAVTTDIANVLKTLGYDRTAVLYSADQENYPEFAWMGGQLPKDAGSLTWAFKDLVGIVYDDLNATEIANLEAANANRFEAVAGGRTTFFGTVASGEYIDIIRGSDKLQTRIAERIFVNLLNNDKIPFTTQGIGVVEADIRAELDISIGENFLVDGSQVVAVPAIDAVSSADKALRFLNDVTFSAQLAGAIHKVEIRGRLTL